MEKFAFVWKSWRLRGKVEVWKDKLLLNFPSLHTASYNFIQKPQT